MIADGILALVYTFIKNGAVGPHPTINLHSGAFLAIVFHICFSAPKKSLISYFYQNGIGSIYEPYTCFSKLVY